MVKRFNGKIKKKVFRRYILTDRNDLKKKLTIIGGVLDRLYPEGDIISPPHQNVQTTIVPPGGTMMTEFKMEVPGKLLLVDHSLSRAIDKGAIGELVVEGSERPEIFKKVQ